jgi:hypothetical protein
VPGGPPTSTTRRNGERARQVPDPCRASGGTARRPAAALHGCCGYAAWGPLRFPLRRAPADREPRQLNDGVQVAGSSRGRPSAHRRGRKHRVACGGAPRGPTAPEASRERRAASAGRRAPASRRRRDRHATAARDRAVERRVVRAPPRARDTAAGSAGGDIPPPLHPARPLRVEAFIVSGFSSGMTASCATPRIFPQEPHLQLRVVSAQAASGGNAKSKCGCSTRFRECCGMRVLARAGTGARTRGSRRDLRL